MTDNDKNPMIHGVSLFEWIVLWAFCFAGAVRGGFLEGHGLAGVLLATAVLIFYSVFWYACLRRRGGHTERTSQSSGGTLTKNTASFRLAKSMFRYYSPYFYGGIAVFIAGAFMHLFASPLDVLSLRFIGYFFGGFLSGAFFGGLVLGVRKYMIRRAVF